MPAPSTGIAASVRDYLRLGNRVGHHGTVPEDPGTEQPFLQLLRLREAGGARTGGLSVLLWMWHPHRGVIGFWFEGEDMTRAVALLGMCGEVSPTQWYDFLNGQKERSIIRECTLDAASLEELVQSRLT